MSDNEILDLVDEGSLTRAQALLTKKIKKFPNRSYYYALNNQILHKQGQTSKAITNNLALLNKFPNDPQAVGLLYDFFDQLGYEKEAISAYENVVKRYPTSSLPLLIEWFQRSVGKFDSKAYSKIFSSIYKIDKLRLYTFWHSFAYLLQIRASQQKESGTKTSGQLSGKISEKEATLFKSLGMKIIQDLTPETPDELYVYVKFLEMNGEYAEIVNVLQTSSLMNLELQLIFLDSLVQAENWQLLHTVSAHLLFVKKFDDFDTWKLFVMAAKKVGVTYQELNDKVTGAPKSRNTCLTLIEAAITYDQPAPFDNYFENYFHKLCCFPDLKFYLDHLGPQFIMKLKTQFKEIIESNPTSVNDLTKLVNIQKLLYVLVHKESKSLESTVEQDTQVATDSKGSQPSFDDEIDDYVNNNWKIYSIYSSNTSIRGGEFDNNPLNQLTLISVVLDLRRDLSTPNIIKNITILLHLLKSDEYNQNLKLWLIKLISNLNSTNLVNYYYKKLNIKMVQHETLGYLLSPTSPSKDSLSDLVTIYRFYLQTDDELKSSITKGFEKGVFTKMESAINFGSRLANSKSKNFVVLSIIKFSLMLNDFGYLTYFVDFLKSNSQRLLDTVEFVDNCDYTSEWKAISIFNDHDLLSKPTQKQFTTAHIKLSAIKYLIMFENDAEKITTYMKHYNKVMATNKSPDTLFYKLDQSLLKLLKQNLNQNEVQSNLNYILKNLNFDKLKTELLLDILSWATNHNIMSLVEFIKTAQFLLKRSSSKYPQLKAACDQLSSELKKIGAVNKQISELKEIKKTLKFHDSIQIEDLDKSFNLLSDSITESAVFLRGL